MMTPDTIICTDDRSVWRAWLEENYDKGTCVWLVMPSKDSGQTGILYNDAVEEALCFGWIDSTIIPHGENIRIQRYTPRRKGSSYSQLNIERLKNLDSKGMIIPEVREQVIDLINEEFVFPEDIMDELRKDPDTWNNYCGFSESYKRIRVAYISAARDRPEEFRKRLDNFLSKTRQNKLICAYGGSEKYYQ